MIRINGTELPTALVIPALVFTFWLGGLSYTVYANDENLEDHEGLVAHEGSKEQLARIDERQQALREDVRELKDSTDKVIELLNQIRAEAQNE